LDYNTCYRKKGLSDFTNSKIFEIYFLWAAPL